MSKKYRDSHSRTRDSYTEFYSELRKARREHTSAIWLDYQFVRQKDTLRKARESMGMAQPKRDMRLWRGWNYGIHRIWRDKQWAQANIRELYRNSSNYRISSVASYR